MTQLIVNLPTKHDALMLAMTRDMMGSVTPEDEDPRDATVEEAKAFWEKRFTDSIVFFGKKYQVKLLEEAGEEPLDISID